MPNKYALITGANRGIGFELARQLGTKGYIVIITARRQDAVDAVITSLQSKEIEVQGYLLDVTDANSIRQFFEVVSQKVPQIDLLINNAAVMLDHNMTILSANNDLVEKTFLTNTFGPFRMIQSFEPLLENGSRVINISSEGGQLQKGASTWAPLYCSSKTTLNAFTLQFAAALANKGVAVNACCPGWTKTAMGGDLAPRTIEQSAAAIVYVAELPITVTGKFFADYKEIDW